MLCASLVLQGGIVCAVYFSSAGGRNCVVLLCAGGRNCVVLCT